MTKKGKCKDCLKMVDVLDVVPKGTERILWNAIAAQHAYGCDWVRTRGEVGQGLTETLLLRLSDLQRDAWKLAAERKQMKLAAWIRLMLDTAAKSK